MILAQGRRRDARGDAVSAWHGRSAWEDDVEASLVSLQGSMLRQRLHVSSTAIMAVALHDSQTATGSSGGDVATAHETVGRRLGVSKSVVFRARRWLREMRLAVTVAEGRYLTVAERRAARSGQIRAASTRVLTHPPGSPRIRRADRRRPSRDYLPRNGVNTPLSHVLDRSPRRAVDNLPRPIWAQRLAARIAEECPRVVAHRHIGQLVTGLINLALPPGITAIELLREIDYHGAPEPSTPVRDPLAWFLHQARSVTGHILDRWDRPTAPLQHVHDFRAMLSPTIRGCLTCPATKETA